MDINVISGDQNQVTIFTNSGTQLVGAQAAQLSFDAVGTMTPQSQWNANPALRGVGTITLIPPAGTPVDLIQNHAIRSGTIAAYLQMRDQDLVQAQTQLDALAAAMAQALSNKAIREHCGQSGAAGRLRYRYWPACPPAIPSPSTTPTPRPPRRTP